MYQARGWGILERMGAFTKTAESATTGAAGRAALERDRRAIEQNDDLIGLMRELVAEVQRTNKLLEWQGQNRPA